MCDVPDLLPCPKDSMSCRHNLANGTCIRRYPTNPDDRHSADRIDPGPESDYAPNMEGCGAGAAEPAEHHRADDVKQPTAAETKQLILHLIRCYGNARGAEVGADWRDNPKAFERHGATAKEAWGAIEAEIDELLAPAARMAPGVVAADIALGKIGLTIHTRERQGMANLPAGEERDRLVCARADMDPSRKRDSAINDVDEQEIQEVLGVLEYVGEQSIKAARAHKIVSRVWVELVALRRHEGTFAVGDGTAQCEIERLRAEIDRHLQERLRQAGRNVELSLALGAHAKACQAEVDRLRTEWDNGHPVIVR